MYLIHWRPLRHLRLVGRTVEPFFDWRFPILWDMPDLRLPAVEVSETDDAVLVKAEVPGLDKKNLKLSVDDGSLVIRGEAKEEKRQDRSNFHRREIRYGSIYRRVPLPAEVRSDKAKAKLRKGVLEVTLPKTDEAKARHIKVDFE